MVKAVVDRIVDDKYLVLLVGEEEKEYIVPLSELNSHLTEGSWVMVQIDSNNEIIDIQLNEKEIKERQESIQDKMALLRVKKGSKFKTE